MTRPAADPVRLEICHQLLAAICDEAGVRLQQSAASANIRQRRDFSVAIFDGRGRLVAQAAHIPVHLGSAGDAVAAVRAAMALEPGDVALLNDPYQGGTHLPDVTMVLPVFEPGHRQPSWFAVNRAHHADIGGAAPGSMAIQSDLHGEGLVLPPVRLRRRGKLQDDVLRLLLANVRGGAERRLDLAAQEGSLQLLAGRLLQLTRDWGSSTLHRYAAHLMDYTERSGRQALRALRHGTFHGADALEDDGMGHGPLPLVLALHSRRSGLVFDWSASARQAQGGLNANRSVVVAACAYAVRCLCPRRLPTNDGLFRLFAVRTRRGTVVDPIRPAPVAGGNVETSQRLVDVCFAALDRALPGVLPACSAGTMSNLAFGGRTAAGTDFTSYETLPGGAGAGPHRSGRAAVQTHMTNTHNTPIEEIEQRLPLRVERYTIRRGSGGRGRHRGGDGLVKAVQALAPLSVSFLGERHRSGPPGRAGGKGGAPGRLLRQGRSGPRRLPSKCSFTLPAGYVVVVETPGGGGHGRA